MLRLIVVVTSIVAGAHNLCLATVSQIDTSKYSPRSGIPGDAGVTFTREQDSMYKQALSTVISPQSRFEFESHLVTQALRTMAAIGPLPSPWENIQRNLDIPAQMLAPSPQEVAQYRLAIANSQYVPGVLLFPMGRGTFTATFGDIARVFGLTEDVSPSIAYRVDATMEVSIVIYSASAIVVRQMFRGIQSAGTYHVVWDGKNDDGRIVPNGDYISEVRLGTLQIVRKRIVVPFP
ncbi:MAG: hypothetical protein HYX66_00505 [Ignavibacteria bacterium]|nr:hypothetical protein [Ignavibacteria bacterium]